MLKKFISEQNISDIIINNIESDMHIQTLTPLQRDVFENPAFWNWERNPEQFHLLIQGATSSGKTLIAEMAMAKYLSDESCWTSEEEPAMEAKVIYLAPLRAMVTEKMKTFQKHMHNFKERVYASSADHQNDDESIQAGDYDIAVMVFEKFFALTAQMNAGHPMLKGCGLIVVDEIQLLGSVDRGPKLEFALTKIRKYFPQIRIIGLTTVYSDVDSVQEWLSAEKISNPYRALPLNEYLIYSKDSVGYYKGFYTPATLEYYENETNQNAEELKEKIIKEKERKLGTDGTEQKEWKLESLHSSANPRARRYLNKNNILLNILKKYVTQESEIKRKIIIFTHSRRNTEQLCSILCNSGILRQKDLDHELMISLNNLDDEELTSRLAGFLRYGVAFHYSSLSSATRSLIENQFVNGIVNIIIATETLAIGVNLPADMIIVYDTERNMSNGSRSAIEVQSYKNYIGRAGRYHGEKYGDNILEPISYLLAKNETEFNQYRHFYINSNPTKVKSAFTKLAIEDKAPYYLNVLSDTMQLSELSQISELRFRNNANEDGAEKDDNVEEIMEQLVEYKLVHKTGARPGPGHRRKEAAYNRNDLGNKMAPFALSLDTCELIDYYFVGRSSFEGEENTEVIGCLPKNYDADDLSDNKYLLDILFCICLCTEMEQAGKNIIPSSETREYLLTKQAIRKYINDPKKAGELWNDSPIVKQFKDIDMGSWGSGDVAAMIKAILLQRWTMGELRNEIKRETGFDKFSFTLGDLDRMSDVASFITEAISKCMMLRDIDGKYGLERAFYTLSNRIKYGANKEMVRILNTHVFGVSRKAIIEIWRNEVQNQKENLYECLKNMNSIKLSHYGISESQRDEIIEIYRRRYNDFSLPLKNQIDRLYGDHIINNDIHNICNEYFAEQCDWRETIIKLLLQQRNLQCVSIKAKTITPKDRLYMIYSKTNRIYLIFAEDNMISYTEIVSLYRDFIDSHAEDKICIVYRSLNQLSNYSDFEQNYSNHQFISMSAETMMRLYFTSIAQQEKDMPSMFLHVLSVETGVLTDSKVSKWTSMFDTVKDSIDEQNTHELIPSYNNKNVFISYSSQAVPSTVSWMETIVEELDQSQIEFFYDKKSIKADEYFIDRINMALKLAKCFILFVDKEYGKEGWTHIELNAALASKIKRKTAILALIIDREGKTFWENHMIASQIQTIYCGDNMTQEKKKEILNVISNKLQEQEK